MLVEKERGLRLLSDLRAEQVREVFELKEQHDMNVQAALDYQKERMNAEVKGKPHSRTRTHTHIHTYTHSHTHTHTYTYTYTHIDINTQKCTNKWMHICTQTYMHTLHTHHVRAHRLIDTHTHTTSMHISSHTIHNIIINTHILTYLSTAFSPCPFKIHFKKV